jgi:DNA repair exonuclease SbcCD ATPase subunit
MILKEALNLSVYSKYEKRAREKSSELAKKIAGHKAVVSLLGKPTDDIILYNKQLSEVNEAIKVKEAEQEQLIIAAAEYKDNLALLQKSIGSEAVDVQNKLQDLNKLKIKTQNDLDKTNKFILEKENILKILQERKNNKEKTLKQLIKEYDGHKEVICREQSVIKEDLKKASENENNGKAHIISLENKLKELQKPFPTGSKCPQCRQAVQEEHRNECLIKISTEISSFLEDISSKKKMLESIGIKKIKLENELSSAVEHISTCNSLKYQIENKKNDIQSDIEYYKQAEEMISFLIKERDIHSNNLLASCVKEQELQDLIKEINIDNTNLKIFNIKSEIKKINEKLSAIISDISSLRIETGSIAEKISSKEKNLTQLQELNSTIKTLEKEYKIKQIVVQGFSSSGIPTVIIYTILDDLQIEANKILQELRPGLELQFSIIKSKNDGQQEDTLDISYRLRGVEYEGEQLSGGQKMLIALSLRIGLAFVIQRRLGIDIKFLALDEVDEKLDEGRVEAFMSLIKKLQQTHKVFVISHNKNLQKRFSKIIMVENDEENGSTAKVSDLW